MEGVSCERPDPPLVTTGRELLLRLFDLKAPAAQSGLFISVAPKRERPPEISEAPRPADLEMTGEAGRDLSSAPMRAVQMTN
jgi:hypothetical protein